MFAIFGQVPAPDPLVKFSPVEGGGLGQLINIMLKALVVGAGVYAVVNLVLAGYAFMSASGDPKKVEGAWAKIWQTLMGLAFAAGAFVLAAIFGRLLFGDWYFLLRPSIPTL